MTKSPVLVVMRREFRQELLALLDRLGVSVLAATGCNEALEHIQPRSNVHTVLVDTELADGNWKTLLTQMKHRGLAVPVVVCSNYPTPELVGSVFEHGAFDMLMAPYTEAELRQILDSAISRSRVATYASPESHRI